MRCEDANPLLIEYAENTLSAEQFEQVETHLPGCEACRADLEAITRWRAMAGNWHDEVVPHREPARLPGHDLFESLRLWFPTAASAAALAMATLIFVQQPQQTNGVLPVQQPAVAADYETLPPLPQATQAAMVQSVMEGSRQQRAEELQAILKILKAEMDRRSIETEESLRFIISKQLQGQQELDELYKQVEALMVHPASANAGQAGPAARPAQHKGTVNR